jgi:hypothetical protein
MANPSSQVRADRGSAIDAQFGCVMTGDVIRSGRLPSSAGNRLVEVLHGAGAATSELVGKAAMPLGVDVFRGDSWQLLLTEPRHALRAALLFRAHLRAHLEPDSREPVDTRIALAVGPIGAPLPRRTSEGSGETFRLSGRTLERMAASRRMVLATENLDTLADWDVVFRLLDELATDWTAKQARAVAGALRGLQQGQIAAAWTPPITQSTVAGHLGAARWAATEDTVLAFERRFAALSPREIRTTSEMDR